MKPRIILTQLCKANLKPEQIAPYCLCYLEDELKIVACKVSLV